MTLRVLPRRRFGGLLLALGATVAVGAGLTARPRLAQADGPGPTAYLLVMHGTQGDAGSHVDDAILKRMPELKHQLQKPPFNSYGDYKFLSDKDLAMKKGEPVNHVLPNGRTLQLTLLDVDGKKFLVRAAINEPGGQAFLKLLEMKVDPDKAFFVGGQSFQGGGLVLGIKVR